MVGARLTDCQLLGRLERHALPGEHVGHQVAPGPAVGGRRSRRPADRRAGRPGPRTAPMRRAPLRGIPSRRGTCRHGSPGTGAPMLESPPCSGAGTTSRPSSPTARRTTAHHRARYAPSSEGLPKGVARRTGRRLRPWHRDPGAERDLPRLVRRDRRAADRLARGRGSRRSGRRRRPVGTADSDRIDDPVWRAEFTLQRRLAAISRDRPAGVRRRTRHDLGHDGGLVGVGSASAQPRPDDRLPPPSDGNGRGRHRGWLPRPLARGSTSSLRPPT